jgi:Ser/Thr protein kinase RdoA (MazF antagonist)
VERQVHSDAGTVLRRFHDAERERTDPDATERRIRSYRRWVDRAPGGLLAADELAFAENYVTLLRQLPPIPVVPTHGDWSSRNWLVTGGKVGVIDFEMAEHARWTKDLERLWWAEWHDRPDLRAAFLGGYGRSLTDSESIAFQANCVLAQVTTIVWATQHGDQDFAEHGRATLRRIRDGSID